MYNPRTKGTFKLKCAFRFTLFIAWRNIFFFQCTIHQRLIGFGVGSADFLVPALSHLLTLSLRISQYLASGGTFCYNWKTGLSASDVRYVIFLTKMMIVPPQCKEHFVPIEISNIKLVVRDGYVILQRQQKFKKLQKFYGSEYLWQATNVIVKWKIKKSMQFLEFCEN